MLSMREYITNEFSMAFLVVASRYYLPAKKRWIKHENNKSLAEYWIEEFGLWMACSSTYIFIFYILFHAFCIKIPVIILVYLIAWIIFPLPPPLCTHWAVGIRAEIMDTPIKLITGQSKSSRWKTVLLSVTAYTVWYLGLLEDGQWVPCPVYVLPLTCVIVAHMIVFLG